MYLPAFMSVAAAFLGVWLISLIAVILIVCREAPPEYKCSLALFIIALPVASAVIYFIAHAGKRERGTLTVENAAPESGLERAAFNCCGIGGADYDKAVYLSGGEQYFDLLFKEIERAESKVYLEYFIFCRGKVFNRLLSALRKANSNGAEIKIIIDGIGSAFRTGRKEMKKLKSAGAEIKIFHKLNPFGYSRLNFRDHRKIAVIDGNAAFIGGFNLADEYANIDSPYGYWKDTGVAVYGEAAEVFEGLFLSVWLGGYKMELKGGGKGRCLPYYDNPPSRSGFLENAYAYAISAARERVHIFTPYFCATEKLAAALQFAAMRGVDVRIIIPHIPDKKYAFELSKSSAMPLIKKGVKFYEFTPGFMHAKSMVCDNQVFIGSYNFDFRSMHLNYECGIMFTGDICERAERDFWDCLRLSSPVQEQKLSPTRRFKRFFVKLFAPLM